MLSRTLFLLALLISNCPLFAQLPELVKDINPTGSSSIDLLTCLDGKIYFRATDGVHGAEPWVSDGTAAGTVMLRDINPGAGDSYPAPFVAFNGAMYFGANDGVNGEQLWMTDGTPAGTVVVPAIYEGFTNAIGFTEFDGELYFQGATDASGAELWATDGTVEGTHLVKDIVPGTDGSYPGHFAVFNGRLFFSASDGTTGNELWASDGTEAGTALVKDITSGSSNPDQFAVLGDHLLFAAYELASGGEIWITDGTADGTVLLKDINPTGDSSPRGLCTYGDRVFFGAGTPADGGEIWVTDGTTAGTSLFMDIFPGPTTSQARRLTAFNGYLYFTATASDEEATQLWRSNGTVGGTAPVYDAAHTAGPLNGNNAVRGCGGQLFFDAGYSVGIGEELYTLSVPTGVNDTVVLSDAPIWPNPCTDRVHVPFVPGMQATFYTTDGRAVLRAQRTTDVDVSALRAGVYVVRLSDASGTLRYERLVKE